MGADWGGLWMTDAESRVTRQHRVMPHGHFRPPPFHPDRPSLVAPVRIDPTGESGPTKAQARGSGWRSPSRGLYVPSDVEVVVEQRIVEAAALIPEGRGAVTGWAALRWLRARWLTGATPDDPHGLPVDLAMTGDIRPRAGINICEERWSPFEVVVVDGLPVTIPERSVAFAMRYAAGIRAAVEVCAMAAYDDLVSRHEMETYIGPAPRFGLSSWTGVPQARAALPLVSENAWSPQEVTMSLIWQLDAHLPRPLLNQPVFDRNGRHVGTPDLLDVEAGLVGEYNGALHLIGERPAADVRREERFRDVGLECFTMLAGDSANREEMARRMEAARRRARWLPPDQRAWTVEPPPWWIPTVTVEQRRRLTPEQRRRLLRHRRPA